MTATVQKQPKQQGYTPGPWHIRNEKDNQGYRGVAVQSADGLCVANIVMDLHDREQANARLIAAAPDLLAALKLAFVQLQGKCGAPFRDLVPTTWRQMEAAIAKAEGR